MASAETGEADPAHGPGARRSPDAAERMIRELRAAGRLAEAAGLVSSLGPYGAADGPDGTTALGAAVLEALGDQLAAVAADGMAAGDAGPAAPGAGDLAAASAAYQRAAADQRAFAAAATSGGEGLARMAEADRIEAKRLR